jgi:hypothetical protein
MNKDEHILRVLTRIKHKKYEHFAISRIMHKIFDTDIKFVCQQLVRRPNGRGNALLDIYFPQLNISLEIDEPQHENPVHKASDKERTRDIITVADLIEKRISVLDSGVPSLAKTARETDQFLELLLATAEKARNNISSWRPWDFDNELTAKPHLQRGYIDAREGVLLRKHIDAIALFGKVLGGHQPGGWTPPKSFDLSMVWFPRLYKNDKWDNSLSDDGMKIVEKKLNDEGAFILGPSNYGDNHKRAVFARKEEPLVGVLYRFVGVFEYSPADSVKENADIYYKISDRIDLKVKV